MAASRSAASDNQKTAAAQQLPAAKLISFLRDYGIGTWTERDAFEDC